MNSDDRSTRVPGAPLTRAVTPVTDPASAAGVWRIVDAGPVPVTASMLRVGWDDDCSSLTDAQRDALLALDDRQVEAALCSAFADYRRAWHVILDTVRAAATEALLNDLDDPVTSGDDPR